MNKTTKRNAFRITALGLIAALVSAVMLLTIAGTTAYAAEAFARSNQGQMLNSEIITDVQVRPVNRGTPVSPSDDLTAIYPTLGVSVGVTGFEGAYALTNPNEIVEIEVQFRTPPAVAIRLALEGRLSIALERIFPDHDITNMTPEELALTAHTAFEEQLAGLRRDDTVEIFSRHHSLFNGMHLRAPASMVEAIAALPEVFAVRPVMVFTIPAPPVLQVR